MTAIIPYAGDSLQQAASWATLPADERRRRAVAACRDRDAVTLIALADAFQLLHGSSGAKRSAHTTRAYAAGIRALLDAWQGEALLHPGRDAAVLWLRQMEQGGKATSTVTVRLAAARSLYAALRWAGATEADPFKDAKPARDTTPKWAKRLPYAPWEIDQVLSSCPDAGTRVLVLLGAHAGLRVSECVNLRFDQVSFPRRELFVKEGKGGKDRHVGCSRTLLAAIEAYRPESDGVRVVPYRTTDQARAAMRRVCTVAGVEYKAVHSLRHACGTRLIKEGRSLEDAARHLGHSTIEVTRAYVHWSNEDLKDSVDSW